MVINIVMSIVVYACNFYHCISGGKNPICNHEMHVVITSKGAKASCSEKRQKREVVVVKKLSWIETLAMVVLYRKFQA